MSNIEPDGMYNFSGRKFETEMMQVICNIYIASRTIIIPIIVNYTDCCAMCMTV